MPSLLEVATALRKSLLLRRPMNQVGTLSSFLYSHSFWSPTTHSLTHSLTHPPTHSFRWNLHSARTPFRCELQSQWHNERSGKLRVYRHMEEPRWTKWNHSTISGKKSLNLSGLVIIVVVEGEIPGRLELLPQDLRALIGCILQSLPPHPPHWRSSWCPVRVFYRRLTYGIVFCNKLFTSLW